MHSVVLEWAVFGPILRSPQRCGGILRHSTQTPPVNSPHPGAPARSSQTKRRILYAKFIMPIFTILELGFHLRRPVGTIGPNPHCWYWICPEPHRASGYRG